MKYSLSIPVTYEKIGSGEKINELINTVASEFLDEGVIITRNQPTGPVMSPNIVLDIEVKDADKDFETAELSVRIANSALKIVSEIL